MVEENARGGINRLLTDKGCMKVVWGYDYGAR